MFPWNITINLFDERNINVAIISVTKHFATVQQALEYAHDEGAYACSKASGFWYTVEVR